MLDAARTPVDLDGRPTVRVYGPLGLVTAATVLGTLLDGGTVTGGTGSTPIVLASVAHGLTDGTYVTVKGVLGLTAANGSWPVTRVDADHFSLDGSVGNGSYLAGGAWNVTGLYTYAVDCTAADGFEAGSTYYVLISGSVAGQPTADQQTFIVV